MLEKNQLIQLAKVVAKAERSNPVAYSVNGENFNYAQLNETLRRELNEYAGTPQLYRENKPFIFSLIEQTIDEVLPELMQISYDQFAEVKQFAQGDKPIFRRKMTTSKLRAKQFITRAGLAGRYEVFKLPSNREEAFEIRTSAIAGAAQIGMEEFLDGRVDFAELTKIVMDGLNELIYEEIAKALYEGIAQLPPMNRVAAAGFDEAAFDELLIKANAFGGEPTIYCTYEFAVRMIPQEAWRYTDSMKDELNRTGRLANYKGKNIVIIPQGFKDETLTTKVIDPGFCWLIPSGVDSKPVKVALEGNTLVKDSDNDDWSKDIQVYKKVGVSCIMSTNTFIYIDTSLVNQMNAWSLEHTVKNVITLKDSTVTTTAA